MSSLISQHEGVRTQVYTDTAGIPTIGIGFNLQKAGAPQRIAALGVDYAQLCAGQCGLTDVEVQTLFSQDLDTAIGDTRALVSNFDSLPDNAQTAIVDMVFNLGGPRFSQFKATIAALVAEDFAQAADQMASSLWATQVPNRAADDIALVRNCA